MLIKWIVKHFCYKQYLFISITFLASSSLAMWNRSYNPYSYNQQASALVKYANPADDLPSFTNVQRFEIYKNIFLPKTPIIHIYNPLISDNKYAASYPIVLSLTKGAINDKLNFPPPITNYLAGCNISYFFVFQNNPWDEYISRLLRPHYFIFDAAQLAANNKSAIDVCVFGINGEHIEGNTENELFLKNQKIYIHKTNQLDIGFPGDMIIASSYDIKKITDQKSKKVTEEIFIPTTNDMRIMSSQSGATYDLSPNVTHVFYSIIKIANTQNAVVTLHVIASNDDFIRIKEEILQQENAIEESLSEVTIPNALANIQQDQYYDSKASKIFNTQYKTSLTMQELIKTITDNLNELQANEINKFFNATMGGK